MIVVIGKAYSKFYEYLSEHTDWGLIWDSRQDVQPPEAPFRIDIDFGNITFDRLKKTLPSGVDGVVWIYERYILPAAQIAEAIGVKSIPAEAAQACTDKVLMRQHFSRASQRISPDFRHVNSWKDCQDFANSHKFPLILKPANLVKSLLVTKSDSLDELERNYRETLQAISGAYARYAPDRTPSILIEEYMEGSVHSVEGFADRNGNITVLEDLVDYLTAQEAGYNDTFHYSRLLPSRLPEATRQEIRHIASIGMQSLGLASTAAHVEIILTDAGPKIVEIGARNGGYRERMHRIANGIDLYGALVENAAGRPINVRSKRRGNCAVIELFPRNEGKFAGISNEDKLKELSSLNYFSVKHAPNQVIGKASQGHKATAVIILAKEDKVQLEKDLAFVKNSVEVTVS